MIADIMFAFPSFTYEHILREMTFKQFLLWHMQALRVQHGVELNLSETMDVQKELDDINSKFKWNEEKKRWE